MVRPVTSFGRSGLSDWLVQRASAVVILLFTLCVGSFLILHPDLTLAEWRRYFSHTPMRVFALLALLSIIAHTWIGMWAVSTDYLTVRLLGPKANALRLLFQVAYKLILFTYFVWGIQVIWGY